MKKSQVMAAIALAFALGVVAPISSASAFEVKTQEYATDTATGLATCGELNTALKAVMDSAEYKTVKAVKTAVADYTVDIADTNYDALVNLFKSLPTVNNTTETQKSFATLFNRATADFAAAYSATAPASTVSIDDARGIINAARALPHYDQVVALAEAMNTRTDLSAAVNGVATVFTGGYDILSGDAGFIETNYVSVASNLLDTTYGTGLVKFYEDVSKSVDALTTELNNVVEGKKAYDEALSPAGVLTDAAHDTYVAQSVDTNVTLIHDLRILANNTANFEMSNVWFNGLYTNVGSMTRTLADGTVVATCNDKTNEMTNFRNVWTLAQSYKAATDRISTDTKLIAEELVNYVAPDEPGTDEPGTDEPGTDEPGTDEPGTEVPADPSKPSVDGIGGGSINSVGDGASFGTPDTGVVTKSEGSASASVAIMAAISTVVAGLGAAIVAIRNFKRNKNA